MTHLLLHKTPNSVSSELGAAQSTRRAALEASSPVAAGQKICAMWSKTNIAGGRNMITYRPGCHSRPVVSRSKKASVRSARWGRFFTCELTRAANSAKPLGLSNRGNAVVRADESYDQIGDAAAPEFLATVSHDFPFVQSSRIWCSRSVKSR